MNIILALVVLIPVGVVLLSRAGHCGSIGKKVRNSDAWALRDAIAEKKRELSELEGLLSKYPLEK
jgi:hypothetical protein